MGKPTGKKKSATPGASPRTPASPMAAKPTTIDRSKTIAIPSAKPTTTDRTRSTASMAAFDEDTAIFITLSQELKEDGNKLFQKRDHEGAMLKYKKALKLLPKNHIDVAYLKSNMAACYMQMGVGEYPKAIEECNLALEVSPKYSKALLKRAKCYEALDRLDLACRDVNSVLAMEPNNMTGLELLESVKKGMAEKGVSFDEKVIGLDNVEEGGDSGDDGGGGGGNNDDEKGVNRLQKVVKEKVKKKKKSDVKGEEKKARVQKEKKEKDKEKDKEKEKEMVLNDEVVKKDVAVVKPVTRAVKLVLGEDIRKAQLPMNCSVGLLRDVVKDRFPGLKGVLLKYRDYEGDLVTITSTDELRLAESGSDPKSSLRFFVVEVGLDQEPAYDRKRVVQDESKGDKKDGDNRNVAVEGTTVEKKPTCIDDWIVEFARLFKNHLGLESDSYMNLHDLGMKLYSEALEDIVTGEDAQELFDIAADKFQEMVALAFFNWGNVHLSKARKRVFYAKDGTSESMLAQAKTAYEWAKKEYAKARLRYHEALKVKPEFYEAILALGQQQFEQAKLCWYNAIGSDIDLESGSSEEVLDLYNKAEDCMERGMQMWEEMEEQRQNGLSKFEKYRPELQKAGLDGLIKEVSPEEAAEQASNMGSQIYLLWATMLYERSIVEYQLELPTWDECLEVSVEKFELAGASQTDIAVMLKNHCSNGTSLEGKLQILQLNRFIKLVICWI